MELARLQKNCKPAKALTAPSWSAGRRQYLLETCSTNAPDVGKGQRRVSKRAAAAHSTLAARYVA
jgi:hypothetical protein